MVSWSILWEHLLGLVLLWTCVALAGFALSPILRLRLGLAGVPLLGVVFWSITLYLVPFRGGLDVAVALIGLLSAVHAIRWWRAGAHRPVWTRPSWSMAILLIGSFPYTTTLLLHYVPFHMDASMHTTAATLIAQTCGLPESYAPFTPDIPLPPINLGLPALAGVAIRWGGEPAAVLLAAHHLTFTLLILATYLLLRAWVGRTPAALIAVVSVWMARATQVSVEWGGFPTVLSVAVGLFAVRLLWQHGSASNWRLALTTGAAIAAIPLVHGIGAGTWLYCAGPWIVLAALLQANRPWLALRGFALTGAAVIVFLLLYRAAGPIEVQANEMDWTRAWQLAAMPTDGNDGLVAVEYLRKNAGSSIVLIGWATLGVLLIRCQWRAAAGLTAAWLALWLVLVNVRWWVLPASFLLYPDRAIYWAAPMSAVGLALAWRALPDNWRRPGAATTALGALMLSVAAYSHNHLYQRIVRAEYITADGWEALVWARQNLTPGRDFVQAPYNSTGSFLPAVARIACTGSHHHHFIQRHVQAAYGQRTVTHVLVDQALAPQTALPAGTVVFRNQTITITRLATD